MLSRVSAATIPSSPGLIAFMNPTYGACIYMSTLIV
jgi:hypothetical protein